MKSHGFRLLVLAAIALAVLFHPDGSSVVGQGPAKGGPKLEPIAETRLLMEGLAHANFKGLERTLERKPTEDDAWRFGRGQAILIAETANLLMLRPPKNSGEQAWMDRATELRAASIGLARLIANRDYERSKAAMTVLAGTCNRCHQTFRVAVEIQPFAPNPPVRKVSISSGP